MKRLIQRKFTYLLAAVFALYVGCASPPKAPKAVKTVAFITNTTSDFWRIVRKGCEKADAELPDVTVNFQTTNDGTITQDSDAPDTDRALYLGADNRAAGRQAGELIRRAIPQGGKIMVFVGRREVQNSLERFEGLKESLQGSNVQIIDLMTDDGDSTRARENAYQALKKFPDIAGMVGLWSYNGPAIVRALRPEGKVGSIKIVCFDDDKETLAGIKEGVIFGTVAQQPFEYGYETVKTAAKILKGDRSVIPASKTILIPTVVVQHNNVDEYSKKLNQLLGIPG